MVDLRAPYAVPRVEQVGLMLEAVREQPFEWLLCRLLYFGGLRAGEVQGLSWGDLSAEQRTLFIREGKGSKDRYVLLDRLTTQLLEEHGERFPLGKGQVGKVFRAAAMECGLYQHFASQGLVFSPHAFRHAFATHRIERGMSFGLLSRLLGHALASETVTYSRRARLQLAEVYATCNPFASTRARAAVEVERAEDGGTPPSFPALREREREFAAQPQAISFIGLPAVPSPGEVLRLLEQAQGEPRLQLFFRLLYVTGLWPAMLLGLQPAHMDMERRRLHVGGLEAPVERDSWDRLVSAVDGPPDEPVFDFSLGQAEDFFLQCASASGLARRFQAMGRALGLASLRYAFASHCCARNIDPVSLLRILGIRYHETTESYFRSAMNRHLPAYDASTPACL